MEHPFSLIIFVSYIIFIIVFAVQYIRLRIIENELKKSVENNKKYLDLSNDASFTDIRSQSFILERIKDKDFFINDYMEEAFNIFLKLSPAMISTLTKADRRLLSLKTMIENDMLFEADIKIEIETIDNLLDMFVKVSHQMIEKLEEVTSTSHLNISYSQLPRESVESYAAAVNVLLELADNHSDINYDIHCRLLNKYPDLIEPFRIISGKITYLLFINLISYSNKIDENVFLFY